MELRHLRYFAAVVEAGSFVGAARELHISQPPLSRQIKDLEAELGVVLLERRRTGVIPTDGGAAFYEGARALLDQVDRLVERTQRIDRGEEGRLVVGYSQSGAWLLVDTLTRFHARHPQVEVQLEEMLAARQARALRRGEAHLTLGYRLPVLRQRGIRATSLFEDAMHIAVPGDWWRSHESLDALGELALLTLPEPTAPGLRRRLLGALSDLGVVPSAVRGVASVRSVLTLVGCGMGFGVVPESIASRGAPGVEFLRPPELTMSLSTYAFTWNDSPLIDNFLAHLHEVVREQRG